MRARREGGGERETCTCGSGLGGCTGCLGWGTCAMELLAWRHALHVRLSTRRPSRVRGMGTSSSKTRTSISTTWADQPPQPYTPGVPNTRPRPSLPSPPQNTSAPTRFYSGLIKFRREHALLGRDTFLTDRDVTWHESHWDDPESRFLAFTLHDR